MNGWTGKLLRVNLTTGQSAVESSEKYFDYIGGKGMANRIIYEEVPNGTEPTAPESKIVMAIGPNTGTNAPCSGRTTLASYGVQIEGDSAEDVQWLAEKIAKELAQ